MLPTSYYLSVCPSLFDPVCKFDSLTPMERYYETKYARHAERQIHDAEGRIRTQMQSELHMQQTQMQMQMQTQMQMQMQMQFQNAMMMSQFNGGEAMSDSMKMQAALRPLQSEIHSLTAQLRAQPQDASRVNSMESRLEAVESAGQRCFEQLESKIRRLEEQALRAGLSLEDDSAQDMPFAQAPDRDAGVLALVPDQQSSVFTGIDAPALPTTLAEIGAMPMPQIQALVVAHNDSFGIAFGDSLEVCHAKLACTLMKASQRSVEMVDL